MTTCGQSLDALTERLKTLEKQNRWLKKAILLVAIVAGSTVFMGQVLPKSHVLEAEKFVLVDAEGKVRGMLSVGSDGPHLLLADATQKAQVKLIATRFGPNLWLYDTKGVMRAMLNVSADGPHLAMYAEDGKLIFHMP